MENKLFQMEKYTKVSIKRANLTVKEKLYIIMVSFKKENLKMEFSIKQKHLIEDNLLCLMKE